MSRPQDNAERIAFDPAAPQDERAEALAGLQKAHAPTSLRDLVMPQDDMREVVEYISGQWQDAQVAKALAHNVVPFPSKNAKERKRGMQSVHLDHLQITAMGDYWEKPGAFGFDSMRQMVAQTPVLNAVLLTRVRQVQRFCRVNESGEGPGFTIAHIDRGHELSESEQESIRLLNRFMTNCGWEFNPRARRRLRRDSFPQFMAKLVRDSLTLDSTPIETELARDRNLGIDGLYAVDGATIRLCSENGYHGDDEVFALQVVSGRISAAYNFDELVYEPRNPQSDVLTSGYGLAETELMIRVVTGFLNAMSYNIKGFDSNAIPKGVLHLTGNYDDREIAAFKRYWNSMVRGVQNAWSLPVMVSKDQESKAGFEKFGVEFDEMYFSKWMTFLTSIICAIYGMSPAEINFDSFTAGNTSALAGSDTDEKLAASRDSGLWPLLAYFEGVFTDYVISDFSEKYVFRWTGIDQDDKAKREERARLVMTVNEMRAQERMAPLPGDFGDAPINPSLTGVWMQLKQAEQPQDFGQPPGGDPGQGGGDEGGEDGGGESDDMAAAGGQDAGEQPQDAGAPPDDGQQFGKADGGGNPHHDAKTGRFASGPLRLGGDVVAPLDTETPVLRGKTTAWAKRRWSSESGGARESVKNEDPDFDHEVVIAWQGVKHAIKGANHAELRLIPHIPEIIQRMRLMRSEADKADRDHIKNAHFLSADVVLDGEPLSVGVVVRETLNGQFFYDQFLLKEKMRKSAPPLGIPGNGMQGVSCRSFLQPVGGGEAILPAQAEYSNATITKAIGMPPVIRLTLPGVEDEAPSQ